MYVEVDFSDLTPMDVSRIIDDIPTEIVRAAIFRASDRAAEGGRTYIRSRLAQRFGVPVSYFAKRFKLTRSKHREKVGSRLFIGLSPIRAIDLQPVQRPKGVSFRTNGRKKSVAAGSFFATMKSGHRGVFTREGASRLPIVEETVSIYEEGRRLANEYVAGEGKQRFEDTFRTDMRARVKRRLAGARPRGNVI